jgi:hypothetical protein
VDFFGLFLRLSSFLFFDPARQPLDAPARHSPPSPGPDPSPPVALLNSGCFSRPPRPAPQVGGVVWDMRRWGPRLVDPDNQSHQHGRCGWALGSTKTEPPDVSPPTATTHACSPGAGPLPPPARRRAVDVTAGAAPPTGATLPRAPRTPPLPAEGARLYPHTPTAPSPLRHSPALDRPSASAGRVLSGGGPPCSTALPEGVHVFPIAALPGRRRASSRSGSFAPPSRDRHADRRCLRRLRARAGEGCVVTAAGAGVAFGARLRFAIARAGGPRTTTHAVRTV